MNLRLKNVKDSKVREILLENIGRIGSVESYEPVVSQLENGRNMEAVKALASIRDGRVSEVLKGLSNRYHYRNQQAYFEALGNTRDLQWLPYLEQHSLKSGASAESAKAAIRKIKAVEEYQIH